MANRMPAIGRTEREETATANRFEQLFQRRPRGGQDPMRPRFARHEAHVAAVMAAGGYPVLAR